MNLHRREFLCGALAAAAIQPSRCFADVGEAEVDPLRFGAIGNGLADDGPALRKALRYAFENRLPVNGKGAVFAVRGNLDIRSVAGPWIRMLRLRQLDPANDRKTLHFRGCQSIRIDGLEIDLGSSRRTGYMNDSGGLWIDGGANHQVANVDVFGHGKNSLIAIWNTTRSSYSDLRARDAEFDDRAVPNDAMQGMFLLRNTDCVLNRPVVSNLAGNASFRGSRLRTLRTRGIALGGNQRVSVIDARVAHVDQGIDFTGSDGNLHCSVVRGQAVDCASVGLKFANSAEHCRAENFVAERCGAIGFLVSGPSELLAHHTSDIELAGCTALDAGYNHLPTTSAGFMVQAGAGATGALARYPRGVRIIDCQAIDRQARPTMDYGFYSNVVPAPSEAPNALVNSSSKGHRIAARSGRWR